MIPIPWWSGSGICRPRCNNRRPSKRRGTSGERRQSPVFLLSPLGPRPSPLFSRLPIESNRRTDTRPQQPGGAALVDGHLQPFTAGNQSDQRTRPGVGIGADDVRHFNAGNVDALGALVERKRLAGNVADEIAEMIDE